MRIIHGWAKKIFARVLKVAKFHFHHSKLRKQLFFAKRLMGTCQISKSLGALPPSDAHAPKTFYDQKAEENNKNIFTNEHITNFENKIH